MATSITPVVQRPTYFSGDIIADSDADTTLSFDPGMSSLTPTDFQFTPLDVTHTATTQPADISAWAIQTSTLAGTNITCVKTTNAGSGVVGAQVRLVAQLPHSIV